MQIEVSGWHNDDGSTFPQWVFEIDPACERILVDAPGRCGRKDPLVWGFRDGRQVNAKLIEYTPDQMLTG